MQLETMLINKYRSIPIISRAFFTIGMGVTILAYLDFISSYNLIYSWPHIKRLELWRALTTFFYWGPATLDVLIHQMFMLKYSVMLEESCTDPSEFLYMVLVGMGIILGFGSCMKLSKLSSSLSTYLIYIWCKKNPLIMVQYMNLINIPAYYTPCLMLLFSFLLEKKVPHNDIIGIVAGHTYFYLKTVYPKTSGRDVLGTPEFLKLLFKRPMPSSSTSQGTPRAAASARRVATIHTIEEEA
ncbi:Derlin-2/3 [Nematocida sp. AWRm77]|nr:Derlin-2/3 [Nematocida sp. AWRm77]